APHSSRRMQHVHMGDLGEWRRHPLQREPRFKQRKVECLAVVGDDARQIAGKLADGFEQCALSREIRQEELPQAESPAIEPAAANEKRIRARATGETRGLEVEK